MENKVVIIGNDHINTLGVIRIFGENNIKPYVYLISNSKNNAVTKSKYVEKYWICKNEEAALNSIIKEFKNEKEKIALIPTSDSSCLCLDKNYDKLKDNFYTPNINKQNNNIYKYMDKFKQQELLEKSDIKGIKSQIINLNSFNNKFIVEFPIILKPNISAEGNKNDIRICNNIDEFNDVTQELLKLGYNSILAQDFISYDYECDIQGFSYNGETTIPGIVEKIRIFPPKRGSTTYGKVVSNDKYQKTINGIKKIMKNLDYTGIFDIDIFISNKDDENEYIYLNEINFRNSAISYAYGESYIAYFWYLSCVNNRLIEPPYIEDEYTFIDDQADLHNITNNTISLKSYLKDKKKSKILLVKNKKDSKPSRTMFVNKIKKKLVI